MNIFTQSNIQQYNTRGSTTGVGEYVLRNGVWAMSISPTPFYKNYGDESYILRGDFKLNTQYIVDLWIDSDSVIYQEHNVGGGLVLNYTDGTTKNIIVTGGSGVGWQHTKFVTDRAKSVKDITVYYYVSTPVYYRLDSYISPLANTSTVLKTGVVDTGEFTEPQFASIGKGYINATDFIEI